MCYNNRENQLVMCRLLNMPYETGCVIQRAISDNFKPDSITNVYSILRTQKVDGRTESNRYLGNQRKQIRLLGDLWEGRLTVRTCSPVQNRIKTKHRVIELRKKRYRHFCYEGVA